MDHTRTPAYRLTEFLGAARRSSSAGCRASGLADDATATHIELHFQEAPGGPERVLGLRAELRDGVAVIVLYEQSELAPPRRADVP
jgi:hypothetical protein